jgi:CARDB
MHLLPKALHLSSRFLGLVFSLLVLPSALLAQNAITPTAVVTTSQWVNLNAGVRGKMIDGSGLNGVGPELLQTHDQLATAETMWHAGPDAGGISGGATGNPPVVNGQAVEFDLGANYDLTAAHIWNMNQAGSVSRGVRHMQILVSSSTTAAFTPLVNAELNQGTGLAGLPAQVVSLGGTSNVRRVRFSIQSAWSGATHDYVGLSEVRFQGTLTPTVFTGNPITPTEVLTTSMWDTAGRGGHMGKIIDGSGLVGSGSELTRAHDNISNANSWHTGGFFGGISGGNLGTPPLVNGQTVQFDLGANYNLSAAHIWNFNGSGFTGRGVKDVQIFISSNSSGDFTPLITTQFNKASGENNLAAQVVPLTTATNVRRVRFTIQSAWSGETHEYVGLSEVRFQGILTPTVFTGNPITPTEVLTTSMWDTPGRGGHMGKIIDGSGLVGSGSELTRTHDNISNANSWHVGGFFGGVSGGNLGTPPLVNGQAVDFDLGANYNLSAAHIWNFNGSGVTDRGVKDVQILISSSTNAAFTPLSTTQFARASGLNTLAAQVVPLTATNVRRVRFVIASAWSGAASEYVGLSEVRFQGSVLVPNQAPVFSLPPTVQVPPGETWTALTAAPALSFTRVASSGDGSTLLTSAAFTGDQFGTGHIYSSADSGMTWTKRRFFQPGAPPNSEPDQYWTSLAMSADGGKVFATAGGNMGGWLLSSDDLGANWTVRDSTAFNNWSGVACSSDGMKVCAVLVNQVGGIFTSTNGGQTLTQRNLVMAYYSGVASSADGTKLVAVELKDGTLGGRVWTSSDSGVTWGIRTTAGVRNWTKVASSADGTKIGAVVNGGKIYVSADSGASWVERVTDANRDWLDISLSSDGTRMAATANGGQIWISNDGGATWMARATSNTWNGIAYNRTGTGTKLVATAGDGIHTSVGSTVPYTVTVNAGSGAASVPSVATGISAGAGETGQAVSFLVTNDNNALFSVQPALSADGTLTFTPALITGTATVTVRAQDSGGTANGGVDTSAAQTFLINVPVDTAGTWSTAAWNGDSSSGIVPGQMLWARRFGSSTAVTINSTTLTGVATSPHSSAQFDLSSPPFSLTDSNNLTSGSGGSATVAQSFFWGGDTKLTVKGLTAGQPYILSMLSVGWDADTNFRMVNFGSGSDVLRVDQSQFGNDNGIRVEYAFTPTTATRSFTVALANPNEARFHLYGLSLRLGGASLNAPITDISLGNNIVAENGSPNSPVGNLSVSDTDTTQTPTFEFVSGTGATDNAAFSLAGNTLTLNDTANFEAKSTYSIRVRATDGGFPSTSFEKTFTIAVANINEPPSIIALDNASIAEGTPAGLAFFGTFSTAGDPDTNPRNHSFQLVSGQGSADNSAFQISGNSIRNLVVPDLDTKPTYSIRIRVTDVADELFFVEKVFIITVVDVNERPTITNLPDVTINEDQATTAIALTVGDPETPATNLTVTSTSSNPALLPNSSVVLGGSGASRTLTATPVANLSGSSTITISVNDGTFTTTDTFVLTVTAVNDVPSFTLAAGAPYTRYLGGGATSIPVIASSSPGPEEASQTLSYLVTNTNNGLFSVQPSISPTGTLTFTPLAMASAGTATVSVQVRDSGGTTDGGVNTSAVQTFVLNLIINTAPTDINLSNAVLEENNAPGATVATLAATDTHGEEHIFSLVAGTGATDNAAFRISGAALTLNAPANFEAKSSYSLRIRATDRGEPALTFEKIFTITVSNTNDTPSDLTLGRTTFTEERGPGAFVGTLSTLDQDVGQTFTYTLVAGTGDTDNDTFTIVGNELKTATNVSFETKSSLAFRLRVTDNGSPAAFFEKAVTLNITNVNESPTDIVLSRNTWVEDPWQGASSLSNMASLSAVDPEPTQTHTYAIAESNGNDDNARFRIVTIGTTRWLQNTKDLDFEEKSLLKVRVRATDNGSPPQSFVKELSLPITNLDDPLFLDGLVASQRPGSKLVDIGYSLRDEDAGTTVPVSFQVSSDGGANWTIPITSSTGDLGAAVAPGSLTYLAHVKGGRLHEVTAAAARNITWNGATNFNEQFSTRMRVRVTAGSLTVTSNDFTLDTRGDGNLAITGRVVSRTTQLPLAGATLQIGTRSITSAADGSFRLNNIANGELNVALTQYLPISRTINASAGTLELGLGNIELHPDTTDPVVDQASPDVDGMIISGFKVQTPIRINVEWGTGTPGQVIVRRNSTVAPFSAVIATFTGPGPSYLTPIIDIDSNFAASFDPKVNTITIEAINSLGVRSALETLKMSVIPLPANLANLKPTAPNAVLQFPPVQIPGQPAKPLNHLGFEYGSFEESVKIKVPELGNYGFSFGCGGSFDYTISDGNWENAFIVGDIELFGTQFRNAKQFSRPGNAYDVDAERPTLEVYLGDRTIKGSVVARELGNATATTGIVPGRIQAALAVEFDDKIGEVYTLDLVPPLKGVPKKIKKIFGVIAVYSQIGLNGSGTVVPADPPMNPKPRIVEGTVGGALGVRCALEIDHWLGDATVYVGGISNVTFAHPPPLLRNASIRFYAGYEIDSFIYRKKGRTTIGEWSYVAPTGRSVRSFAPLGKPEQLSDWQPIDRYWRNAGNESFLQKLPEATGGRTKRSTATPQISPELATFNSLGATRSTRVIPVDPNLPAQANLPLLDNVFPKAKPSLAGRDGKLMLAYVRDTGATNPVQFTEVAFTYYDGTTWTTPGPIAADVRGQLEPQVAFDGAGNSVAVWVRVKDAAFAGINGPEELAPELEVVSSSWSAITQSWSPVVVLTNNTVLDHKPALSGPLTNGDLMLGWVRNRANEIGGSGAVGDLTNDQFLTARWNSSTQTWGSEVMVNPSVINNTSVSFAARGDKAAFVWNQDMDGDFDTSEDTELFAQQWNGSSWTAAQRVTNDALEDRTAQVGVSASGQIYTLWVSGTDLVMQNNFTGARSIVRPDSGDTGFSDCTLTVADNGRVIALWQAMSQTGPDAYYRVYDPATATWGLDDQLSRDSSIEKSFSAVWDSAGNLVIAYNNVEMVKTDQTITLDDGSTQVIKDVPTPDTNDLLIARRRIITDLGFVPDSIRAVGDSFLPGARVTLQATVKNTGNLPTQDTQVAFYLGDPAAGGTIIGTKTIAGLLRATEEQLIEQLWTVPTGLTGTIRIFAVVDPLAQVSEFSEANNQLLFETAGQDLELRFLEAKPLRDLSFTVRARVTNTGSSPSAVTDLKLADDFTEGAAAVLSTTVSRLAPGQSLELVLSVPPGNFPGGDKSYRLLLNEAGRNSEITSSDNQSNFIISLFIDDDGDGIPLEWEQANGMSDSNAADALLDGDGDGFSNGAEYLAGTNPRNKNSVLRVGEFNVVPVVGSQGHVFTISWASVTGKSYIIERSTDLTEWTAIATGITATAPLNTYTDEVLTVQKAFYRIRPQ